jgi:NAD(P)-dependent dehydrogenase (short-subunit alcohol dehydrogenase family)
MSQLTGKIALVLGADSIGRGIALRLAREGAVVGILDADAARAQAVAGEIGGGALGQEFVPDAGGVQAAIEALIGRLGGAHILVCNTLPGANPASLEDQDAAAFGDALAAVGLAAAAMRAVFPTFSAQRWGRIITIGHRYGETVNEAIGPYNAAAWALVGLTRSAALDWGRHQIAVNLLLPLAETPEYRAAHEQRPRIIDLWTGQLPLRRVGDPVEDIGAAALFLASDDSAFVTGQTIHADGGQHVAGPVLNPVKFAPTRATS